MATQTSFVQFERCELCRRNHTQGRKHVYSKKHQEIVKNILQKFKKKIKSALENLYLPHVEAEHWESGARCWCYFCKAECDKHERVGNVTLRNSGFLQHLAKIEHRTCAEEFWKVNRVESKKTNGFVLEEHQIKRYHARAEEMIQKYVKKIEGERKQIAGNLHKKDELRARLVEHVRYETHVQKQMINAMKTQQTRRMRIPSIGSSRLVPQPTRGDLGPVRTIAAHGQGLTCIMLPSEKDTTITGNVHSGATPPWMINDPGDDATNSTEGKVMGPTQEDFDKHLEIERKRKLPASRVGANFDHKGTSSATWLPSFGRVWNNQRRLNSRQQFEKSEWKRSHKVADTQVETKPVAQPYMSKRPPTATLAREHYEALQPDATSSAVLN